MVIRMQLHKIFNIIFMLFFSVFIVGCASQTSVGYGTITKVESVRNSDGSLKHATLKEAGTGAKVGAGIGAGTGVVAGSAVALATFGIGAVLMPAFVAAGAGAGAGIGAGVGAGVGHGMGLYQYSVRLDNKSDNLTIAQYVRYPLPLQTRVEVFLDGDRYSLKKIG